PRRLAGRFGLLLPAHGVRPLGLEKPTTSTQEYADADHFGFPFFRRLMDSSKISSEMMYSSFVSVIAGSSPADFHFCIRRLSGPKISNRRVVETISPLRSTGRRRTLRLTAGAPSLESFSDTRRP